MSICNSKRTRAEFIAALLGIGLLSTSTQRTTACSRKILALPGVNLAGAAWGNIEDTRPLGQSHIYPADEVFSYWSRLGMKIVRLSFWIERLQPVEGGLFEALEIREIDRCVVAAEKASLTIILDLHNYGQRAHRQMTSADLSRFFALLATRYAGQPHVAYGVMNEPYVFTPAEWQPLLRTAVKAIRSVTKTALILAPGGGWDGAYDFVSSGNAAAFDSFADANCLIEVHQYFDHDSSGRNPKEYVPGSGTKVLREVTDWARTNGRRLFLGEFGFSMPAGEKEASALLRYMSYNNDVWVGYSIWAAGPWWGDYAFSVEPREGKDALQIPVLRRFM